MLAYIAPAPAPPEMEPGKPIYAILYLAKHSAMRMESTAEFDT